jgi:hypothetical protein
MHLDTGEIARPPSPPDVSTVKGILSSYIFLFLVTIDWESGYLNSKVTVWKEEQSTVLPVKV